MKNRILCAVFALAILLSMLSGCTQNKGDVADVANIIPQKTAGNDVNATEFTTIAKTDSLELKFNKNTTHFIVVNLKNGKEYSSLPQEELDGSVGRNSLFDITYLNENGNVTSMSSYEDCVAKGQYKVENIDSGVKIIFTLGNVTEKLFCPTAFSENRFNEITSKIEKAFDRNQFKALYYKVDIDNITDSAMRSDLISKYPKLKNETLYILKNESLSLSVKKKINDILVSTGYDNSDYEEDMAGLAELEKKEYPLFNVSMYLKLDENGLKVELPISEISEFYGGKLLSINLLKYFISPSPQSEGYFLLPDASGSKMYFYNGKNDKQMYSVSVYGNDKSIKVDEKIYRQDVAYLPFFASIKEDDAVMCQIVDAESFANVNAVPGDATTHAQAYSSFQIRQVSQTYLSSSSKEQGDFFYVTQEKLYDGSIELLYRFFTDENANLDSLAKCLNKSIFAMTTEKTAAPLLLEFVGVDNIKKSVMGISTEEEAVFTTINQVLDILKDLKSNGIDSMQVKLSGYFNNGLSQPYAAGIKLNKKVGSKEDLNNLINWANENNVEIYFDVDIQYVYNSNLFNFNIRKNVCSMINKKMAKDYGYNLATYQLDTTEKFRYVLNSSAISNAADHIVELTDDIKTGFSLAYVGSDVNSDYRKSNSIERQNALKLLVNDVSRIAEKTSIITKGSNAALLPYVSSVTDVSMRAMQYDICDETVPFLQMVLGGNVYYYDEHRNISGNTQMSLLDTMRVGGGLSYLLTADENLVFAKTEHNNYTSTKYSVWKDIIIKEYNYTSLVNVHTSTGIVDSQMVGTLMYKTDYADGSSIIANYSSESQNYNGEIVKPYDYIVIESEG